MHTTIGGNGMALPLEMPSFGIIGNLHGFMNMMNFLMNHSFLLFWGGGHLGEAMTEKKMTSILGGQKAAFLAKIIKDLFPPSHLQDSLRRGFALHQATRSGLATKFPKRKCAANLT